MHEAFYAKCLDFALFCPKNTQGPFYGSVSGKEHTMSRNGFLLWILLAAATVSTQGCMVAAVGAAAVGTVAYVRGDLEAVETAPIDNVYDAALAAMEELQIRVLSKSKDALSATITGRDAADKKLTIKLKVATEGITKLSMRIGVFGSETKSRLIHQKIKEHL